MQYIDNEFRFCSGFLYMWRMQDCCQVL